MRRLVHLITPGDHFSPRTGRGIPPGVHGLSAYRPDDEPRPSVLVAAGTYPDRYDSAEAIEYHLPHPSGSRLRSRGTPIGCSACAAFRVSSSGARCAARSAHARPGTRSS